MTNEKAIEILEECWRYAKTYKYTDAEIREALDLAIKTLEKDIEKEPIQPETYFTHGEKYEPYYCPTCNSFMKTEPVGDRFKRESRVTRCEECGQKIVWRETE